MITATHRAGAWLSSLFHETDTSWPLKLGYIGIGIMAAALTFWSAVMPLAESIIAPGTISVSAQRRSIAHVDGGKVAKLHIKEGDYVEAEQPLITLDGSRTRSELEALHYQRYARQAKIDRLIAERDRVETISFHDELVKEAASNLQVAQILESEVRQFSSRRDALAAKDALHAERGQKAKEQRQHFVLQRESMDRQITIVRRQAANAEELYGKGFGTKSSAHAFQRELEQLITQRLQIDTKINELDGVIEDSSLNRKIGETQIADEIERDITNAQREVAELSKKIDVVRRRLDNLVIKSSVEGAVVALRVKSTNDVVKPADPILDIIPVDSTFMVEAHVSPTKIDGIVAALPVEIRFPSFATLQIPAISGRIVSVSADVLDDDQRQQQYYKILISMDNLDELEERNLDIIPGMPTEVIVKKRDRTLFEYALAPLTNHLATAVVD